MASGQGRPDLLVHGSGAGLSGTGRPLARQPFMLAFACTLCHSATAAQVRAALFGSDLLANAAAVLAPAPVLAAVWWLITEAPRGR